MFEFDGGTIVQMNSSWAVRVNRDELFELQVDGTLGSAVAGLRECKVQPAIATPKSVWNPDLADPVAHRDSWIDVPVTEPARQRLQAAVGALPAPRRARRAVQVGLRRGRARRAARRARRAVVARAAVGRRPGADAVSASLIAAARGRRARGLLADAARAAAGARRPSRARGSVTRRRTSSSIRWAAAIPPGPAQLDWEATLAFRRHLWAHGLRVAEAMDTAQRGMGLDWAATQELIRRSVAEARAVGGQLACGAGTDQLVGPASLDEVQAAYEEQLAFIEGEGAPVILMASRALAAAASGPDDYRAVYGALLSQASSPVILHWLGDMFDPLLAGYWGSRRSRRGRRRRARHHRGERRQGRRDQGLAAGRLARGRAAASACPRACACTPATTSTTRS